MKNIHKISIGVTFVSFFFVIAIVHADTGHIGANKQVLAFPGPITGVLIAVNSNNLVIEAQSGSTAAITSYTIESSRARILKSSTASPVSSTYINDNILAVGAVPRTNITAKVIFDSTLPLVRGPPTA